MELRTLGNTGIKVSKICLGTMTFGEQNTQDDAFAQMDYAVDKGVNFIDTAEIYAVPPKAGTYGKTEEMIGNWLQKTGKRKSLIIATKVVGPAPHMPWIRAGKTHLDRANIMAAVDASLTRLKTDYIDLYQTHFPERPVNTFGKLGFEEEKVSGQEQEAIEETLETMGTLVLTGKVRAVGVSNETPWGVMTHLHYYARKDLPRIASIQNPYNLLNRSFEVGLAEIAMQEQVGLLAYSPLAGGTLTGKYLDGKMPAGSRRAVDARVSRYKKPREEEAVRLYLDIAKKHGLDPAQMALAFVNSRPFLTSNIIGATTMAHLKTNIESLDVKLSAEVVGDINAAHAALSNPCP